MSFISSPALVITENSSGKITSRELPLESEHCVLFVCNNDLRVVVNPVSAGPGLKFMLAYLPENPSGESGFLILAKEEDLKVIVNRLELLFKTYSAFVKREAKYRIVYGDEIGFNAPIPFLLPEAVGSAREIG